MISRAYQLLNGEPLHSTSVESPAIEEIRIASFGDGVFETMLLRNGEVHLLNAHLQRLARGLEVLAMDQGQIADVAADIKTLVQNYSLNRGIFRLKALVGRHGHFSGYSTQNCSLSRRLIAIPVEPVFNDACNLGVSRIRLSSQPALAGIKHCSRLEQILATREREHRGVDECLMLDAADNVIEAISANVVLVESGKLVTPLLDHCGVEGVMRNFLLHSLAPQQGVEVVEDSVTLQRVAASDAVLLTNAISGVKIANRLDIGEQGEMGRSVSWRPNQLAKSLQLSVRQSMFPA